MTIKNYHGKGWRISGTNASGQPLTMLYLGITRLDAMRKFIQKMTHKRGDKRLLHGY